MKIHFPLWGMLAISTGLLGSACRSKEGKGYTPPPADSAGAGGGQTAAPSSGGASSGGADAAGGGAGTGAGGADASGTSTGAGAQPAAPPPVRTLDPKKDQPDQGLPEKSALPKNLEPKK